jgi:hypothetical protein
MELKPSFANLLKALSIYDTLFLVSTRSCLQRYKVQMGGRYFSAKLTGPSTYVKCVTVHCKKRLAIFPSPAGMSLTKTLPGRELTNIPDRGEFGYSDIPAGNRKIVKLFLQCNC